MFIVRHFHGGEFDGVRYHFTGKLPIRETVCFHEWRTPKPRGIPALHRTLTYRLTETDARGVSHYHLEK